MSNTKLQDTRPIVLLALENISNQLLKLYVCHSISYAFAIDAFHIEIFMRNVLNGSGLMTFVII